MSKQLPWKQKTVEWQLLALVVVCAATAQVYVSSKTSQVPVTGFVCRQVVLPSVHPCEMSGAHALCPAVPLQLTVRS